MSNFSVLRYLALRQAIADFGPLHKSWDYVVLIRDVSNTFALLPYLGKLFVTYSGSLLGFYFLRFSCNFNSTQEKVYSYVIVQFYIFTSQVPTTFVFTHTCQMHQQSSSRSCLVHPEASLLVVHVCSADLFSVALTLHQYLQH